MSSLWKMFARIRNVIVFLFELSLFASSVSVTLGQGLSPDQSVQRMTLAEGMKAELVASEPLVRQPVCIEFDDRGRLWVIQYLQYPNPEGLNRIEVDRYSRTKYDRIPEPPPKGPRGADRITILEDQDGDGRMDHSHDFVEGLNLATGLAFGHGGVFVLNVPYLLFYPDRDRNDRPDSDPEVLLSGFGMEDAHSVANSLTWGPDGWLYGCQGSTVTANVRGIEFQQGVWRYHPETREFELFCEGGGNSWGLDFDRNGNLYYSTNYGGFVMLHGVQGGNFVKSFAKHGALHNPHAYGYFEHVPHQGFRGGHVTVGGIVYQGGLFPKNYHNAYIAADLLGHGVYWHSISDRGSTVQTRYAGELLHANDDWFAPTDVVCGPDGAIYVADWHDARTAHPDPDADWDRTNGRIYRIAPVNSNREPSFDLATYTSDQLLQLLSNDNQWKVRRARQELVRRKDRSLIPTLQGRATGSENEREAIEALWTMASIDRVLDESLAMKLLDSPFAPVRFWTLRLLGDQREISVEMAHRLDALAETEPSVWVRQQIASTAARLPARFAVPMINANINRDIDLEDPYLPLLWWWSVERHSVDGRDEVMKRFVRPSLWKSRLGSQFLLPRLVRRYASEETKQGWDSVAKLIDAVPSESDRGPLYQAILDGWTDRMPRRSLALSNSPASDFASPPASLANNHPLQKRFLSLWENNKDDFRLLALALATGESTPRDYAFRGALDPNRSEEYRLHCLRSLEGRLDSSSIPRLISWFRTEERDSIRIGALSLLGRFDDPLVGETLLEFHQKSTNATLKTKILDTAFGRKELAATWLAAVERGSISRESIPIDQVRKVALFQSKSLNQVVEKHWGKMEPATREVKLAEVRRLNNDLRAAKGNPVQGKGLFIKHCASCHTLFGEGTKLGPDLTSANRKDRDFLLVSLVDPSSVIRKEYVSVIVRTNDGRILQGLPTERDGTRFVMFNAKKERIELSPNEIEEIRESNVSLMPEDLYRQWKPQELRDLFAYLQGN